MIVDVFQDDDPHIDHRPDSNRDPRQRHDVRVDAKDIHGNERD